MRLEQTEVHPCAFKKHVVGHRLCRMFMTWASDVPPLHSWTTALGSDALLARAVTV